MSTLVERRGYQKSLVSTRFSQVDNGQLETEDLPSAGEIESIAAPQPVSVQLEDPRLDGLRQTVQRNAGAGQASTQAQQSR
jgi:hypothetical protein